MVYRKGELSKFRIDRDWPHQVALESRLCTGDNYLTHRFFCRDLSLCDRGHAFVRDGEYWNVFCFAEREHAERFQQRFGGEIMDPKDRPRWPAKNKKGAA
ncbi:MAG: hypothetical protein Q7T86_02445 [Hyphomicrobiaceae bacterium]|jgi:hypothetical protein|nr:hypothetical protein [Hyphomicrobiaceae bacterium]